MPSHEVIPIRGGLVAPLARKELRDLFLGKSLWVALVVVVLLTGYSYVQAVFLYGEASRTALKSPEMARGLSPLDGIVVPTFGALYLATTFLLPFVAIRLLSAEKQTGSLKLLLQLPYSVTGIMATKTAIAVIAWLLMLVPFLAALALWLSSGGHLGVSETLNVVLGHFLYASVVISISLLTAAVTESSASAAITTLTVTIGFWVIDFAAAGEDGLLKSLAGLSLTNVLRTFEHGVFSLPATSGSLVAALGGITLAGLWVHPGRARAKRWAASIAVVLATLVLTWIASHGHVYRDASEDRRNSFAAADENALRTLDSRLVVEVHLAAEDPRLYDLERSVLGKLRRTVPNVEILYINESANRGLNDETSDKYGQVFYRYNGRESMSRSTNEDQILGLIFDAAGLKRASNQPNAEYPGYPLVAATNSARISFYIVMPVMVMALFGMTQGMSSALRRRLASTIRSER